MRKLARGLLIGVTLIAGCGYGEVSPQAYECAKALYNVSNRKLASHVPKVQQKIADSLEEGAITAREAKWLEAIAEDAAEEP